MISSLSRLVSCAALSYRQAIHTLARLSVLLLALPSAPLHAEDIVTNSYTIYSDYELASPDTITLSEDLFVRGSSSNPTLFLQTGGVLDIGRNLYLGGGASDNGYADYTINGGILNAAVIRNSSYRYERSNRAQVTINGGSVNVGYLYDMENPYYDGTGFDVTINGGSVNIGTLQGSYRGATTLAINSDARIDLYTINNTTNNTSKLILNAGNLSLGSAYTTGTVDITGGNLLITDGSLNLSNRAELHQSTGSVIYGDVITTGSALSKYKVPLIL